MKQRRLTLHTNFFKKKKQVKLLSGPRFDAVRSLGALEPRAEPRPLVLGSSRPTLN